MGVVPPSRFNAGRLRPRATMSAMGRSGWWAHSLGYRPNLSKAVAVCERNRIPVIPLGPWFPVGTLLHYPRHPELRVKSDAASLWVAVRVRYAG